VRQRSRVADGNARQCMFFYSFMPINLLVLTDHKKTMKTQWDRPTEATLTA
jgi:hypothetical protein